MPKLNTYTSQFQGLPISGGRRADAQDFGGDAAAATGELARTTSKVGDALISHQEETEQRRALVGSTEIRAKYARELDQAAQTGADTAAIKEKMEAELSKIGEDFQTTKGQASLEMHSANTSLMFDEQANRIEVQRAAATARMEGQKYMAASSAILMGNPYALKEREQGVDDLVATFKRIPPEKRAEMALELKQNLNMTAALATVRMEPEIAERKLEAGEWTLTGEQRQTALNAVKSEYAGRRAAESARRAQEEYERKRIDDVAQQEHFAAIREGRGSWPALRDDARLMQPTRQQLTKYMDQRAEELANRPKKSNPAVLNALWFDANRPDDDPKKMLTIGPIVAAVARGDVNTTDADRIVGIVKNQKDENNRTIGSTLYTMSTNFGKSLAENPDYWGLKAVGDAPHVLNEFNAMAADKIAAARAANDAVALRDLFNPNSKTFIGSRRTMDEAVQRVNARKSAELKEKELEGLPLIDSVEQYNSFVRSNKPGTKFRNSAGEIGQVPQPQTPGRTATGRIRQGE